MSDAVPQGAELEVRALFRDEAAEAHAERRTHLASDDPDLWEGIAFPVEFALELAAVCNLACVMCPVPTTSRKRRLMDEALFRKAVDEVASETGFVLFPQGFGEPMLHPKWAELLSHAKAKGIGPIVVLTNGTLLDERNVARLLDLDLDALVVSIDGVEPDTYAAVRVGGDLGVVDANVRRFLAARGARSRPRLVLRIIRMKETADQIAAFFERWKPLLGPEDEIAINEFNDWAGKVEDRSDASHPRPAAATTRRPPCRMLWMNLSVHADGKVSACCHDSEDELIVGDLSKGDTVRGIWEGPALARLRQVHREGRFEELPICHACRNQA